MDIEVLKSQINQISKNLFNQELNFFYPEVERGDLSIRAFNILKKEGEQGLELLAKEIKKIEGVKKVERIGGYINLFLDDSVLLNSLDVNIAPQNKTIVLEYPSVNPNKPWHIGHLRNALIGESLAKLFEALGNKTIRINYINDLGLQIAESLYYYFNFNKEKPNEKFDHFIGKQYVEAHALVEKDKEVEKEVREFLKKLEKERIGREVIEKVVLSQYETAKKFKVCTDLIVFESDLAPLFQAGIELLKKNKNVYTPKEGDNKGCLVVNIDGEEKVLIRSDGTLTYLGKDIIFHLWKLGVLKGILFIPWFRLDYCNKTVFSSNIKGEEKHFRGDELINIIGIEQTLPQKVLRKTIEQLGYSGIKHIPYAFVRLKDKHFSGRKGSWIGFTADELFQECLKRLGEKGNEKIARAAINFAFLRRNPKKEVVFDWDSVLSFEGDGGVYLLYSYVRALSILKKTTKKPKRGSIKEERELVLELIKFREVLLNSAKHYDSSILANYLLSISKKFHKFYSEVRVIGSEREEELLFIIQQYLKTMERGLKILNIDPVESM